MSIFPFGYIRARSTVTATVLLATLMVHAGKVHAENMELQPSLEQNVSWDTNPLMITHNPRPTLFGSTTAPKLELSEKTPETELNASASASENVFNQSGFNSTDGHASVKFNQKIERWEAGVQGQSDYDTTRTSELTTFNVDTVGTVRHFGNSITPTIAFNPTLMDKLSLSGSYGESRYDSSLFSNYHTVSVNPSYQHQFTPQDTGVFAVQAQRYETDSGIDGRTDTIGPTIGWIKKLTPNMEAKASVGGQAFKQEGTGISNEEWKLASIYNAELTYKGLQDSLTVGATKAVQPYANGTEAYLTTVSASGAHDFNSLLSANAGASYQHTDNNDNPSTNLKSLITSNAGVTYHATGTFDIVTRYMFKDQELTTGDDKVRESLFTIGLVYKPRQEAIRW